MRTGLRAWSVLSSKPIFPKCGHWGSWSQMIFLKMVQEENCHSWSEKFLWLLKFIVCMHVFLSVPMCGYVHVASTGQPQMSFFGGHPPCFWEELLTGLQLVKWDRLAGQRDPETCLSLPCHLWKCKYVLPCPALFETRFWGSKLWSSHLQGKCLTNWAISPALLL